MSVESDGRGWIGGANIGVTRAPRLVPAVEDPDDFDDEDLRLEPRMKPTEHQPRRPDWHCLVDGQEWPCVAARDYMLIAWEPVSRALTMGARMIQACEDMPAAPAGELYRRFLGWVRNA